MCCSSRRKGCPTDHRNGALLAEMASAYDSEPQKKRDLLNEALRYADTAELKARINDDLKRLGMLGRPLKLKFDSVQGDAIDLGQCTARWCWLFLRRLVRHPDARPATHEGHLQYCPVSSSSSASASMKGDDAAVDQVGLGALLTRWQGMGRPPRPLAGINARHRGLVDNGEICAC